MNRTSTLFCSAFITLVTTAQDWTVGEPVDMLLYTQTFYGGCNPSADYTYTFPTSPVSGVDYLVKITAMDPPDGALNIVPGLPDGGLGDELVFTAGVQRTMTFGNSTNSAVLEFRAQGTPAVAGQAHPCAASAFWISNLMLCPEGLFPNVDEACTVQGGATAIPDTDMPAPMIDLPTAGNGQRLTIGLPSLETGNLHIIDATGRVMLSKYLAQGGAIALSAMPDGAYVLQLSRSTGGSITKRFLISRQ